MKHSSSVRSYYSSKASEAKTTAGQLRGQYKNAEWAGNTEAANSFHAQARDKYSEMAANIAKSRNCKDGD